MSLEPMDDFEVELRQALERRTAPPSLKRKLLERRSALRDARVHSRMVLLQRIAASMVLAAALGGGLTWRHYEQVRKAEAARDQVMTALRIAAHALDEMSAELAGQDRADQE